jgi:hypothetical protein
MSLNIMAPEELRTDRETNTEKKLRDQQAEARKKEEERISAARKAMTINTISVHRALEFTNEKQEQEDVTIEKSLLSRFFDQSQSKAQKLLNEQTSGIGTESHKFEFNDEFVKLFRSQDTTQKTTLLNKSMKTACDNAKSELKSAKTDKTRNQVKNDLITKITELDTAIKDRQQDGTGMLNRDQHLEIMLGKKSFTIEEFKKLTAEELRDLGDITFRIITDAQRTEAQGKIDLETARKTDRDNKDQNKADAKQIKLNKENKKNQALNNEALSLKLKKNLINVFDDPIDAKVIFDIVIEGKYTPAEKVKFEELMTDSNTKTLIEKALQKSNFEKDSKPYSNFMTKLNSPFEKTNQQPDRINPTQDDNSLDLNAASFNDLNINTQQPAAKPEENNRSENTGRSQGGSDGPQGNDNGNGVSKGLTQDEINTIYNETTAALINLSATVDNLREKLAPPLTQPELEAKLIALVPDFKKLSKEQMNEFISRNYYTKI